MNLRTKWEQIVSDWESSGKSQRQYSEEAGVEVGKLNYWKRKLRPEKLEEQPKFKKLEFSTSSTSFELVTTSGTMIRVPERFNAESLKRLLEVLR